MKSAHKKAVFGKVIVYAILILIAVVMIIPFLWMLSASIKSDREVFQMNPFVWIPANPKWDNYVKIWTKIPFGRFVGNTVYLTLIVTFLQLLTSSFAAYSFAKLDFRHKNGLFLAYIATIAMPWQVYMVPQFIMMRRMGLNDKLLAMICLQAFSAFGVFMMKQFYEGIPDDLCEAARIDGMSEYRIYASIMLPLSKPALSTLTIFTFVNTWNLVAPSRYAASSSAFGMVSKNPLAIRNSIPAPPLYTRISATRIMAPSVRFRTFRI